MESHLFSEKVQVVVKKKKFAHQQANLLGSQHIFGNKQRSCKCIVKVVEKTNYAHHDHYLQGRCPQEILPC